jgi:hypothetical protein
MFKKRVILKHHSPQAEATIILLRGPGVLPGPLYLDDAARTGLLFAW